MSLVRNAALRASTVSRVAVARRSASSAAYIPKEIQGDLSKLKLEDPRIPAGAQAYLWPVEPVKDLPKTDFLKRRLAVAEHAEGTTDLWRKITYYICVPALIVAGIYVYQLEKEHEEHLQHIIDENGGEPPERKVYSYMNMRTKQFPWGNQSLFFNPRYNIPAEEQ